MRNWGPLSVATAFVVVYALLGELAFGQAWVIDGYTITPVVNISETANPPSDLEIDASGNLFIITQPDGVRRVTPLGGSSIWSTAPAVDLALFSTGEGLGAGMYPCNCLLAILADGSYLPFSEGYKWTNVAIDPNTDLPFMSINIDYEGIYVFVPNVGPARIVSGGPGPGGEGWYGRMAFGADGLLYTLGNDGSTPGLFRLNPDSTLTKVAQLSQFSFSLAGDPNGMFYASAPLGSTTGAIVMIDPTTGNVTLIAGAFAGGQPNLAWNHSNSLLYAVEPGGQHTVYAIARTTPVEPITWGKLKARYR